MSPAEKRYWGGVREENLRLYHTIQVAMFYFQIWIFLKKKSSFLVGVGFPNMDQNQTIKGEQRSKASPHVWLSSKQKSSPSRCLASLSQTKKNSSSFFSKFCHLLVVMLPCFLFSKWFHSTENIFELIFERCWMLKVKVLTRSHGAGDRRKEGFLEPPHSIGNHF